MIDYKRYIHAAAKVQKVSRYRVGQLLGLKKTSAIYDVEAGRVGLSDEKIIKLLEMGGAKLPAVAVIGVALMTLHSPAADAASRVVEATGCILCQITKWFKRLVSSPCLSMA